MTDDSGEDGDEEEAGGGLPTANHDASEENDKEEDGGGGVDQNTPDSVASVSDADELLQGGEGMAVSQEILGHLSNAAYAEIARAISECFYYSMMSLKPYIVTFIVTM